MKCFNSVLLLIGSLLMLLVNPSEGLAQTQADTLLIKGKLGNRFYYQNKRVKYDRLYDIFYNDLDAYENFKTAQNFRATSQLFRYIGWIAIAVPLGVEWNRQQVYYKVNGSYTRPGRAFLPFLASGGLIYISSVPLRHLYYKHTRKTIRIFNNNRSAKPGQSTRAGIYPGGISIITKF
jgi:hypothetical protein